MDGDCGREPGRLPDHEGLLDHEGTAEGVGVELGRVSGVVAPDGGEHRLIYAGTLLAASRRPALAPRGLVRRFGRQTGWQTGLLRRQSGHASEIQIEYGEEMERVTGIEPA